MAQILLSNGAAQATPAAGVISVYSKTTDKRLYYKDDAGVEIGPLVTSVGQATEAANLVYAGPSSGAAAQPTFRQIVYPDFATSTFVDVSGSTQSIAAATFTALIFPTVATDTLSEYNTTTGAFTPLNAGIYLIWVSTESNTSGITAQRVLVSLNTIANTDGTRILNTFTASSAVLDCSAARPVSLVANTAYYFNIYCSSAEVLSGGAGCALTIKRIG